MAPTLVPKFVSMEILITFLVDISLHESPPGLDWTKIQPGHFD